MERKLTETSEIHFTDSESENEEVSVESGKLVSQLQRRLKPSGAPWKGKVISPKKGPEDPVPVENGGREVIHFTESESEDEACPVPVKRIPVVPLEKVPEPAGQAVKSYFIHFTDRENEDEDGLMDKVQVVASMEALDPTGKKLEYEYDLIHFTDSEDKGDGPPATWKADSPSPGPEKTPGPLKIVGEGGIHFTDSEAEGLNTETTPSLEQCSPVTSVASGKVMSPKRGPDPPENGGREEKHFTDSEDEDEGWPAAGKTESPGPEKTPCPQNIVGEGEIHFTDSESEEEGYPKPKLSTDVPLNGPHVLPSIFGLQPGTTLDQRVLRIFDPKDDFQPHTLGPISDKEIIAQRKSVKFIVRSVDGPDTFYLQNTRHLKELGRLEETMTKWYNEFVYRMMCGEYQFGDAEDGVPEEPKPKVPVINIEPKAFYAAYITEKHSWVRCFVDELISGFGAGKDVLVQLLDHGTTHLVGKKHVLPLRAQFLQLPIQAYLGKLQTSKSKVGGGEPLVLGNGAKLLFRKETENEMFLTRIIGSCLNIVPFPLLSVLFTSKIKDGKQVKFYTICDQLNDARLVPQ